MKIGNFRSFTDPNKTYSIKRLGRKITNGGDGVTWECSCQAFINNGTCKHLKCLFAYSQKDHLDLLLDSGFITLTRDGKRYYHIIERNLLRG